MILCNPQIDNYVLHQPMVDMYSATYTVHFASFINKDYFYLSSSSNVLRSIGAKFKSNSFGN